MIDFCSRINKAIEMKLQNFKLYRPAASRSRVSAMAFALLFCGMPFAYSQKKELDVIKGLMRFSDAPNSLYHHISKIAYTYLDARGKKVGAISTLSDWKKRQILVRQALTEVLGKFPEKTPLNPKITNDIQKDGYRIQNIIFESRPGLYVTSSLFIPDNARKAPAVIYCSGHSETGYRSYQNLLVNLVKKGFVVFAFDPIGQGERLQYYNAEKKRSAFRFPAFEHSYVGAQLFITGNSLANTMIWDGVRALDYLVTRNEVDTSRIGITGRSGGGTQSAYIAAMDSRIKAVAPENYITDLTRMFQTLGPQDAEQIFFHGVVKGLDMADLLTVRAPKPALLIATTMDMFPIRGAEESAREVSRIYQAYNSPEAFNMVTDDGPHASTKKNREAMYAFFQKELNNPGDPADQMIPRLAADDLRVTQDGQVSTSLQSETVFSLNAKDVAVRMRTLEALRNSSSYIPQIISEAKRLSAYKEPGSAAEPLFVGRSPRKGYGIEKYVLTDSQDYPIPYFLFKPDKPSGKGMLYLNPEGNHADAAVGGDIEFLVNNGVTVIVPDLVGHGEMGPGIFKGDSYIDSIPYNTWFSAILVDKSIVGIHAADVVKLSRLLGKDKSITEISALAKREFSPALLHAAAFEKNISRVALINPYSSYRSMVENADYHKDFLFSTVAASVGKYDLPDLAASLAPRKLILVGVTDGNGNSSNAADIEKDLKVIRAAFRNNSTNLQVIPANSASLQKSLLDWLNAR
jgi:dienelactone hydrolase